VINGQSARSLMKRMLVHSDNQATDILLADLGGPHAVHDWLRDNGVTGLSVDRNISDLLHSRRDLWTGAIRARRWPWLTPEAHLQSRVDQTCEPQYLLD